MNLFEERGLVESVQVGFWALSVVAAAWAVLRHGRRRDRLNALWLLLLSVLAMLRELDVHELVNPKDGHQLGGAGAPENRYGVSFKIEWWLDGEVDPLLKAAWGAALLLLAALLIVPPLLVRAPVVRLLRRGDAPTYLFLASVALLGLGYVMDDLLGRGAMMPETYTLVAEETAELLGVMAFFASLVLTVRRPLSTRVG